ncbi:MAG: nuclear transport factor 2 family protein [Candidatus Korobacteraceae bacterium]
MKKQALVMAVVAMFVIAVIVACSRQPAEAQLPPLKTRPTPQAVVDEHLEALNACDWERLMAQYPDNAEVFLPGGMVLQGREKVAEMFRNAVKPFKEGGLCGVKFTPQHTFVVEGTVNASWSANADFLAEPYLGADAYVTKDGLMAAMVTTFDRAAMKVK